jgi:hypothetical protein
MKSFHDDYLLMKIVDPNQFHKTIFNFNLFAFNEDSSSAHEETDPLSRIRRWAINVACLTQQIYVFKTGASTGMTMRLLDSTLDEPPESFYSDLSDSDDDEEGSEDEERDAKQ